MAWLYAIPAWAGLLIVILVAVSLACGGHVMVRRRLIRMELREHNDVAGFILAVVGVLYTVLLAFLTIVVWQHFAEAESRAHTEVDAAVDVWRLSHDLPHAAAQRVQRDLAQYVDLIVGEEWPRMRAGESSPRAQDRIVALLHDVAQLRASDRREAVLQDHLLERWQVMADLRRRRISDNQSGVPPVLWLGILLGAAIVLGFVYLFVVKSGVVQLIMTAGTAAMIAIAIGLILELDYPFRGGVSVSSERWGAFRQSMARERASPAAGAAERRSDRWAGR